MTRQKLLSEICPTDCIRDDICDVRDCSECYSRLNKMLDKYDKQIRAKVIEEIVEDISREYPECNYVADWVERLKENK